VSKGVLVRLELDQSTIATLELFRPIQTLVVFFQLSTHLQSIPPPTLDSPLTSSFPSLPFYPKSHPHLPSTPYSYLYPSSSYLPHPICPCPSHSFPSPHPQTPPRLLLIVRLVLMHPHPSPLHSLSYLVPSAPISSTST
jgi:hypothetical protein